MTPQEEINMWEEKYKLELFVCNRLAYMHQNSKETCKAMKVKLKEMKQKQKEIALSNV